MRIKFMKVRSLLGLTIGLTILCAWSLAVFAQSRQATGNSQMISWPQTVAQQPKSELITWIEFVEQGGGRYIQNDYDLPSEFRNGYVYFNQGASVIGAYILKQGLSSYPPRKLGGQQQINPDIGEKYLKSGKAIFFSWSLSNGSFQRYGRDTEIRFYEKGGKGCLALTCLEAPFMTNEQISRILRSARPIPQKN
ncbi:hypothetical protein [Microcoleus anatoxicus]|uniref:hypothetical protein n=1 Tax=Microcoleus anatoxicus TaxID=2705319 RepID=UPI0030C997A4